ncbi:MAG: hypothetical protein L3J02_02425 [Henriciella sp.]|nr:hypothetical protein [Henriciella sp.]
MTNTVSQTPHDQRFNSALPAMEKQSSRTEARSTEGRGSALVHNLCRKGSNLCKGDTLERFEWFEIMACRSDGSEGCIVLCEAGRAEFWGIYGRANEGTDDDPLFLATAVHDAVTPLEAVRIARQISLETGKGFVAGDTHFGQFPRCNGNVTPVAAFIGIAEGLTFAIHEDNEVKIAPEDQRMDDFDNHPLAELREAFVEYSDYSGGDQRDPYQTIEQVACDQQQMERSGS